MPKHERTLCSDGIVRWCRNSGVRVKQDKVVKQEWVPAEVRAFADKFTEVAANYGFNDLHFCSKAWSRKKSLYITKTLHNLQYAGIEDVDLFIAAQFERAKVYPQAVWYTRISAPSALRVYLDWIKQFPTKIDARRVLHKLNLEDVLKSNHRKYLYYHDTVGWSDELIFKTKAQEFDPLYLLSIPEFVSLYEKNPDVLRNKRSGFEDALRMVSSGKDTVTRFWDIVGRVKCQSQINSTSYSRQRF